MIGLLKIAAVIAVLFFGGRFLVDEFGHGDPWRTADDTTECRKKLGGSYESRAVVAPGADAPEWDEAGVETKRACESAEPD